MHTKQAELKSLTEYDPSIESRVSDIIGGNYPNGHTPDDIFYNAINNSNAVADQKFLEEYNWAIALTVYPYDGIESKNALVECASDVLYEAGERYDPCNEVNFLKHFTNYTQLRLPEVFGAPSKLLKITPYNFDEMVIVDYMQQMPSLATERPSTSFEVGNRIMYLCGKRLEEGIIKLAKPYKSNLSVASSELSESEQEVRYNEVAKRALELKRKHTSYTGVPNRELLRRKINAISAFGRITLNPSQGFIHLTSNLDQVGTITDMHHNTLIHPHEWDSIKSSSLYKDAWIANGSAESLRLSGNLEAAISIRIQEEQSMYNDTEGSARSYARPRLSLIEQIIQ